MAKANTKALSCTIDLDNFNVLAELRWVKRVETMSEMVNFAIAEYVALHKDDLPAAVVEDDLPAAVVEDVKPVEVKPPKA